MRFVAYICAAFMFLCAAHSFVEFSISMAQGKDYEPAVIGAFVFGLGFAVMLYAIVEGKDN